MDEIERTLRRLQWLADALAKADAHAAALRIELYGEMEAALAAGVTISAMSRALGISRQRVQQILRPAREV